MVLVRLTEVASNPAFTATAGREPGAEFAQMPSSPMVDVEGLFRFLGLAKLLVLGVLVGELLPF